MTATHPHFRRIRKQALHPDASEGGELNRIIGIIALALGLLGCLPVTSTSPVGTTRGLGIDRRLVGMWEGSTDKPGWLAFVPDDHGGMTGILIGFPSKKDSSAFYGTYALQTAALGKAEYMNAREMTDNGLVASGPLAKNFMPLLYRFDGERTLTLYLVDDDAAKQVIRAGKIVGVIQNGQFGDVTLTAKPADLDKFFASDAGLKLFTKPFIMLSRAR